MQGKSYHKARYESCIISTRMKDFKKGDPAPARGVIRVVNAMQTFSRMQTVAER